LHPNAVSSSFSCIGQVMPITAARRMYSPTAVRPIPTDLTITASAKGALYHWLVRGDLDGRIIQ